MRGLQAGPPPAPSLTDLFPRALRRLAPRGVDPGFVMEGRSPASTRRQLQREPQPPFLPGGRRRRRDDADAQAAPQLALPMADLVVERGGALGFVPTDLDRAPLLALPVDLLDVREIRVELDGQIRL